MPGRKNPFQISRITERIQAVITRSPKLDTPSPLSLALTESRTQGTPLFMSLVDLTMQFQGASGLPKMDVVGSADPYFVAKLDDKVTYVSAVIPNTLSPVWNETWKIRNVPHGATLHVDVLDKDSNSLTDGYVGQFTFAASSGEHEVKIQDRALKRNRGTFWLKIDSIPSTDPDASMFPYEFAGPVRYSLHFSPTVGRITNVDSRLYCTWKVHLVGVRRFFGDRVQPWNSSYAKVRKIFVGPTSLAVRGVIHTGHRMLYARSGANDFGVIASSADAFHLLHAHAGRGDPLSTTTQSQQNPFLHRVKPAVYTYVISAEDDTLRFSETGARFFVNMASKHALHSNCAEAVRFSGEFHPRPADGWDAFDDTTPDEAVQWELVVDNKSGTYSPDKEMLPAVKALLEHNFEGFKVVTMNYQDPELKKSTDACRQYALSKRGVSREDLHPLPHSGSETLAQRVSAELHRQRGAENEAIPEVKQKGVNGHAEVNGQGHSHPSSC